MRVTDCPRPGQPRWNAFRQQVLAGLEAIVSDVNCRRLPGCAGDSLAYELAERLALVIESDSDVFFLRYLAHELQPLARANFRARIGRHNQLKLF